MSSKNFQQEINKGLPSPAYFIYADNQYLLDEAVSAVKRSSPEAETDFNFNVFDMDPADTTATPEQIIDTLNTVSFFGKRRYVLIKNSQKFTVKDFRKIQAYTDSPSPGAVLMIFHAGTIKKDLRESIKGIKTICLDVKRHELPLWIKEKAKQKGLVIQADAVEYLVGITGDDIGLLSSEIEKLASFGSGTITIVDIKEIVGGSKDYSVFDLTNALREKNAEKAFRIYRKLSETTEPYSLLGAINWQYSRMLAETSDIRRGGKNSASLNEYYQKAFELLSNADIQIKSSGGSYPLEYLLARLLKL